VQSIQMTLPIGTIIRERYIVENLLGKGGFGAVYLVRDLRVKQNLFALKELYDPSKKERDRFTFEGEVLKRLDHPALPHIYRTFNDDKNGRAYILMDYIEGTNLERLRQQQPEKRLALPQVLSLMAPIIDAVSYLHHQHPPIIHRDIKPANIIAPKAGDGTVLVDFGIAKEYDPDSTTTAIRHCSPGYGAPEQYSMGTDTRTDIYGLGATIYALLTGVVPVDAFYRMTQMGSKSIDPLEPVKQLVPSIPVAEAIHRAMALDRDARFPTVEEFWQALNANPLPAYGQQPLVLAPPVRTRTLAAIANSATVSQRLRRPRTLLLLPLLVALLMGIGVAAGFFASTASHSATNSFTPTTTLGPTATGASPAPISTTRPTATSNPAPPTAYPNVNGVHRGAIHNTTAGGITANMSFSIQQKGGSINGSFTVDLPLLGSGPFSGSVTTSNHIQFTVQSNQVPAPLSFQGTVQPDGSMSGTYCSLDQTGHCSSAAGGGGTWDVNP
jgi:serine/threonine protein kinase